MSVRIKPSTVDGRLQDVFGAPVPNLYEMVTSASASLAVTRALELRSFLALAEEQVARVRDRVHHATAPNGDMGELSADDLRFDAQWLEAALDARNGYRAALDGLLRTMPPPSQQPRPVQLGQHRATTTLPPAVAVPAPQRAGAARSTDRESPRLPDATSIEIAGRIEDLYGTPLTVLESQAQEQPPGMLSALLGLHDDLVLAERSIVFHRDRLAQLVLPERQIGGPEVSHVLDCARRLAEAVAVRDVQAKSVSAVLQSLGRAPAPPPSPASGPAAPAASVSPAPVGSAARSR